MEEVIKILKKLVSEGYKLKAQHNNNKWRKALEDAEELIINHKTKQDYYLQRFVYVFGFAFFANMKYTLCQPQ